MRPHRLLATAFATLGMLVVPLCAQAIQLHWSTGSDTLRTTTTTRGVLVVKADVADVKLPGTILLFWRGDGVTVQPLPVDSTIACSGDTANVKALSGPATASDSVANVSTALLCRGSNPNPVLARYAVDIPGNVRAKFEVDAFDTVSPTSVLQSRTVYVNSTVVESYRPVLTLIDAKPQTFVGESANWIAVYTPNDLYFHQVQFFDGTTLLGTMTYPAPGVASFSTSSLAIGSHNITAVIDSVVSNTVTHQVKIGVVTTTALAVQPAAPVVGRGLTLQATVTPSDAVGSVEFKQGTTSLGFGTLAGGVATLAFNGYCAGTGSAAATYLGDATHGPSTGTVQWSALKSPSYVAVRSSAPTVNYADPVHFTATVRDSGASACVRSGSIQFAIDGVALGSAVSIAGDSAVSASISTLLPGSHNVTAAYSGNTDYAAATSPVFAQIVRGPEPVIASVRDVASDQGGKVKVTFNASPLDAAPYLAVDAYYFLRSIPGSIANAASRARASQGDLDTKPSVMRPGTIVTVADPDTTHVWEFIGSQPAFQLPKYSFIASTLSDSMSSGVHWTLFMVMAHSTTPGTNWYSRPDSGYSVDNLAPAVPSGLSAQAAPGGMLVSWQPNGESDLFEYRIYRGTDPNFVPSLANRVGHTSGTSLLDANGHPGDRYKVTAADIHGNESGAAVVTAVADVDGETSLRFALSALSPNPARGSRLSADIVLTRPAGARLELLDVAGRRVASKELGSLTAGRHVIALELSGEVTPGLYLVRLSQGAESRIRRVAILK